MKTSNQIFILLSIAFLISPSLIAQKSVEQKKKQAHFFYTQLNLNGGLLLNDNAKIRFSEVKPWSNISLTFRSKNQNLLQQGSPKPFQWSGYKVNLAFIYKNPIDEDDYSLHQLGLRMRDIWINIRTKRGRTSFKIGHFRLPFGHSPKLDMDNNFIPVIASQDLGFNRDLGIFFKTPFNNKLDIEFAVTLGSSVPATLLTYDVLFKEILADQDINTGRVDFHGNLLNTVRIGNSTTNEKEYGLFAAIGTVSRTSVTKEQSSIYRIGADWTYKYKKKLRVTNQIVIGQTKIENGNSGFSMYQKSEADFFLVNKLMITLSNNLQYQNYMPEDKFRGIVVLSFSYVISPNTRLKLNSFSKYGINDRSNHPGLFFQVVAGFGKRA